MTILRDACEHLVAAQWQMRRLSKLERRIRSSPSPQGCRFVIQYAYATQRQEFARCARVLAASPAANEGWRPAA